MVCRPPAILHRLTCPEGYADAGSSKAADRSPPWQNRVPNAVYTALRGYRTTNRGRVLPENEERMSDRHALLVFSLEDVRIYKRNRTIIETEKEGIIMGIIKATLGGIGGGLADQCN